MCKLDIARKSKEYESLLTGNVSAGSTPAIYTFCTLILYCSLFVNDTWYLKLKKPVTLEYKGYRQRTTLSNPNN